MNFQAKTIVFLFFIISLFTINAGNNPTYTFAAALPNDQPKLVIGRSDIIPEFNAGEEGTLIIPVENIHNCKAEKINATLEVGDPEEFPFEIDRMTLQTQMGVIEGKSSESIVFFNVKPKSNLESGTYPLTVNIDYTSETGSEGHASGTIYVNIIGDHNRPELKYMGLRNDTDEIESGESNTLNLTIKNEGDISAKDIEIKLSGFAANTIGLDQDLDTYIIKECKSQEFKFVPFKIYIADDIEGGTYALDLNIKYKDEYNTQYEENSKVYLQLQETGGNATNKNAVPRLIIDDYSLSGDYAVAGQVFNLRFSFYNTSKVKDVNNIKISLSSDENIFTPVNSSNSFYIDNISARSAVQRSIDLKPKVDAAFKTYNITADIEYEDSKGNKYTEKEIIGIPVMQTIKLHIADLQVPQDCFVGNQVGLSIDFYNTGRALIRNLMIHTEGDFRVRDSELYIGNLESGKSDYYDATIIPEKEGTLEGKIIFQYENEAGTSYQMEKSFTIVAAQQKMPEMPMDVRPDMQPSNKAGGLSNKILFIGGALLLILIITTVIILRRRHRKKQEEVFLDE